MNRLALSRAGLLVTITVVHVALLWAMQTVFNNQHIEAPKPYPMVMAEMLPMQQPKPEPVPQPVPPAPKPEKPVPPKKSAPKPLPKPAPNPEPSERAITTPQEVAQLAPASPPAASAAPTAPASPAPPTPPRFDAAYLNNPAPAYPAMARRMGQEGRVLLRVHVTAEGTADDVRVHTTSGSSLLDEAAIAAVRKWRFVPARQGGDPVAAWVQVPVAFKLN